MIRVWNKNNKLTTVIDHLSIARISLLFVLGVILCSVLFWQLSKSNQGFQASSGSNDVSFYDSIYFSVVTVSSLGYGDYKPVGAGRVIAALEVLYGLILLALLVAKLAGQRQSTIISAFYISEQSRRMQVYLADLEEHQYKISDFIAGKHSSNFMRERIELMRKSVRDIRDYLAMQDEIGMFVAPAQTGSLHRLVNKLLSIARGLLRISRTRSHTYAQRRMIEKLAELCFDLAIQYSKKVPTVDDRRVASQVEMHRSEYLAIRRLLPRKKSGKRNITRKSKITPKLLDRIKIALPEQPWPKYVHKTVAAQLGISIRLAHEAITQLIIDGDYSPQWNGIVDKIEKPDIADDGAV